MRCVFATCVLADLMYAFVVAANVLYDDVIANSDCEWCVCDVLVANVVCMNHAVSIWFYKLCVRSRLADCLCYVCS